jgi:predicted transcriptional regulator
MSMPHFNEINFKMTIKTNHKKFWAYNDIFDVLGNKLKPNGVTVYLCLIRHADRNGQCYPSHKLIANKCGISRMTVIRTINKLIGLDLIQVQKRKSNKGDYSSNLYIIKELSETSDKIDTERVVSESDHHSITKLLPVVSESDHPSITEIPKGRQDEGPLYFKDDETKDGKAINNNTNCNTNLSSSISFKLSELNSPINLSQQDLKALNKLPYNNARQQVLDVLASSLEKGTVERPKAFLQGLVTNYLADDFTPINKSKTFDTNKAERFNNQQLIDNCPYCDKRGVITLEASNGMRTDKRCSHKLDFIKGTDVARITSAKPGYQIPKFEHQVFYNRKNKEQIEEEIRQALKSMNTPKNIPEDLPSNPDYDDDPFKNFDSISYDENDLPF